MWHNGHLLRSKRQVLSQWGRGQREVPGCSILPGPLGRHDGHHAPGTFKPGFTPWGARHKVLSGRRNDKAVPRHPVEAMLPIFTYIINAQCNASYHQAFSTAR